MTDASKLRENDFYTDRFYEGEHTPTMQVRGDYKDLASLFAKLVQVNKSIKRIGKSGKFDAGNTKYGYASEQDVIEPVAAALAKAGLATIPSIVNVSWQDIPGRYGINRVCTVHAEILLADIDTGAYIIANTFSTAANGDKATNAAFTTALKYWLAKLSLTAFGDDGDTVTLEGAQAGKSVAPKAATKQQRDTLAAKIKETGTGDAVKKWMKDNSITFSKITELQATQIDTVVDAQVAMGTPPGTTGAT